MKIASPGPTKKRKIKRSPVNPILFKFTHGSRKKSPQRNTTTNSIQGSSVPCVIYGPSVLKDIHARDNCPWKKKPRGYYGISWWRIMHGNKLPSRKH